MSKQLGNDIELALSEEETSARVMEAVTDPARRYRNDPGHPDICNIFRIHGLFNALRRDELAEQCCSAKIGCVDCKKHLAQEINVALKPLRERRSALATNPQYVNDVLVDGADRARVIAKKTIKEVKQKMGLI